MQASRNEKSCINFATPAIHVKNLRKVYTVSQQEAGTRAAVQGLIRRQKINIDNWLLNRPVVIGLQVCNSGVIIDSSDYI